MFDDNRYNETDDLLRSILSQGEEDVPAHVWEGVSSQLDRISTRRTGMLWWLPVPVPWCPSVLRMIC